MNTRSPDWDELQSFDVAVIGGGFAGISAALILARCRRSVLLLDDGRQRNKPARATHGFITRDGASPKELYALANDELTKYPTVVFRATEVMSVDRDEVSYRLTMREGEQVFARRVILASGLVDELPSIDGFKECYGITVHHCPYCDGYEVADRPLAVYGCGTAARNLALKLTLWSKDICIFTDGKSELTQDEQRSLENHRIAVYDQSIELLEHDRGHLRAVFKEAAPVLRAALFYTTGSEERSALAKQLGCKLNDKSGIHTDDSYQTCIEGAYAAGDILRSEVQFLATAAGQGAACGARVNEDMLKEDLAAVGTLLEAPGVQRQQANA